MSRSDRRASWRRRNAAAGPHAPAAAAPPVPRTVVEVRIDELALRGVPVLDVPALRSALEAGLAGGLAGPGWRSLLQTPARTGLVLAPRFRVAGGSRPERVGRQIATAVVQGVMTR